MSSVKDIPMLEKFLYTLEKYSIIEEKDIYEEKEWLAIRAAIYRYFGRERKRI